MSGDEGEYTLGESLTEGTGGLATGDEIAGGGGNNGERRKRKKKGARLKYYVPYYGQERQQE
jgi:hypothetical protein